MKSVFIVGRFNWVRLRPIQLPNPEIIISTVEKLLKAFENACPPLEGYSDGVLIKVRWEEVKKMRASRNYSFS